MAKIAKNKAAARAAFDGKSNLSVEDAVALVKANVKAKFDETVEIAGQHQIAAVTEDETGSLLQFPREKLWRRGDFHIAGGTAWEGKGV